MGDSMSKARDAFEADAGRRRDADRETAKAHLGEIRETLGAESLAGRVWDRQIPYGVRRVLCEAGRVSIERMKADWADLSDFERSKIQGAATRLRGWATLLAPDTGEALDELRAEGEGAA